VLTRDQNRISVTLDVFGGEKFQRKSVVSNEFFSEQPLCSLCLVVVFAHELETTEQDTESTEIAQRNQIGHHYQESVFVRGLVSELLADHQTAHAAVHDANANAAKL
jgi:hypothetical protein